MSDPIDKPHEALPTGTVTFLFTDIEGSTELARNYPVQWPALIARHHALIQQSIQAHSGYIFQIIGDAFCAAFPTAAEAAEAALEAQGLIQHEAWDPAPILVRMGIHTGAAQAEKLDDRFAGYRGYLTLATVQSILAGAHGGQVLLSGPSAELVRGQMPAGVTFLDMGEHRLKNGLNPEHLWQMTAGDLRAEFPPLKTLSVLPNNLPVQLNNFIGRERVLAQTAELLKNTHLLTLIGPGGTGKTRLALQLAADVLPEFADGVWLVELAPLADPALVLQTVAYALGLREIPGTPLNEVVTGYLRSKSLLLILDNCEHLVETCAQLSESLLRQCHHLKIVASSREALGITGEAVFRVPPMALPDQAVADPVNLHQSEAVQLFVERAAAVRSGFVLNRRNAPAVAQICLRLDGVPLALELAAARVGMLSPEQIAARLDDRFRLLTGGSRTALPRQQTLRSLIDWSYDLLSEAERSLFCQLSVFVGGWSLEAAEAVCPDLDVLDLLAQLVKKSLVVADERAEQAETRFRLLETIRQYARDKLLESGMGAAVRNRHFEYYLKFAEEGEFNIFGPQRLEWVDLCELEHDNLRAALQWGLDNDVEAALRMGGALTNFWAARGFVLEGTRWLQAALDRAVALPEPGEQDLHKRQTACAKGLLGFGQMSYGSGDYRSGLDAAQQAVNLYRQTEDWLSLGFALATTGNLAAFQNDRVLAEQALTEAIQIGRMHNNPLILGFALGVMSKYIFLPRGEIEAARAYAEESGRLSREIGLSWSVGQSELILARIATLYEQWDAARAHALTTVEIAQGLREPLLVNLGVNELGDIELRAGNIDQARQHLQKGLLGWQEIGQKAFVAHELESFAYIARVENQPTRAARLLGAAEAGLEGIGTSTAGVERLEDEYERTVAWLHTQLGEQPYDTYWSEGCGMSMDQAIAFALER